MVSGSRYVLKSVLITGACGAIGRELVRASILSGYCVIATDKHPQYVGEESVTAYLPLELGAFVDSSPLREAWLLRLKSVLGDMKLCGLINNAALQVVEPVENISSDDWDLSIKVNVTAPFLLTQALVADLTAARGSVLNIGSIHARLTKPHFSTYATSKAALAGMTKALAVELGGRIRVNAIEPAAIDTDLLRAGFEKQNLDFDALAACHPSGHIGSPYEVAKLAMTLLDGDLSFLNGACVALDGGIGGRLHDPS
jgi:NAD(P)-dependent dehydrogenase (short-subunit alcohol dehydrogenase family)